MKKQGTAGSGIVVRGARNKAEFDIMVSNAAVAFAHHGATEDLFRGMTSQSPGYTYEDTRLGLIDGKIAGSLNILRRKLVFGSTTVPMGGIADVHIKKEYRGRGVALAILQDAIDYMKKNGMLVSLLFSEYHDFYGKLGWRVLPRPMYVLDIDRKPFLVPDRYKVKQIDWKAALKLIFKMSEFSDDEYSGYTFRDDEYKKSMLKWYHLRHPFCFAAYEKDKPVAACALQKTNHGDLSFHECRNLPGHDEAPKNLLGEALALAQKEHLKTISAPLPETHPVSVKIILLGGRREFDKDIMFLATDPLRLFKALIPEFENRLQNRTAPNGRHHLNVNMDINITFSVNNSSIKVTKYSNSASINFVQKLSDEEYACRISGASTIDGNDLSKTTDFFDSLFKPMNYAFWNADKF